MPKMLSLKIRDWQADGLHVTPRKTQHSSGKSLIFERGVELESAINAVLAQKRPHITDVSFLHPGRQTLHQIRWIDERATVGVATLAEEGAGAFQGT